MQYQILDGARWLRVALAAVVFATACSTGGGPRNNPAGPSAAPQGEPALVAPAEPDDGRPTGVDPPSRGLVRPPGGAAPTDVSFPPRNEPLLFRQALEVKYRDGLRRQAVMTFVDQEGTVVWTQEYLRYRVNLCSHVEAVIRVLQQIDGLGIQPVCGSTSSVVFPPRNEPFDFMVQLEAKYRDGLRRMAAPTFVDVEGNIVWTQEYLRYRVSGCPHLDAQQRVFDQIDGRGVLPDCSQVSGAFVQFRTRANACSCWVGTITLRVDGVTVGTMTCTESRTFPISPGTHTFQACDQSGCATLTDTVSAGSTLILELFCASSTAERRSLYRLGS